MASESNSAHTARVFSVLWAVTLIVHPVAKGVFLPTAMIGVVAATWVLLRPDSWRRLAALAAVQLLAFVVQFPVVSNHWMLVTAVDVALLASLIPRVTEEGRETDGDWTGQLWSDVRRRFEPVARLLVLATYGFAVFHKLNWDYFDPATSCAVALASRLLGPVAAEAPLDQLAAMASVGTETAILVLLALRRTRLYGLAVGLGFHVVVGLTPGLAVFDFSVAICALYWLFVPEAGRNFLVRRLQQQIAPATRKYLGAAVQWVILALTALYAFQFVATHLLDLGDFSALLRNAGRAVATAISGAGLAAVVVLFRKRDNWGPQRGGELRPRRLWQAALLAAFLFNGATPYLGLKTSSSFTMFSNLRTEGGESNHLLVGPEVQMFDYQRDLVRVVATDDPALKNLAGTEVRLPYATFAARATRNPEYRWTIETKAGERRRLELDDLPDPPRGWLAAGIRFTEVKPDGGCFR